MPPECVVEGCTAEKSPRAGLGMCRKHYRRVKAGRDPNQKYADRACTVCGKPFVPSSSNSKYCDACAVEARIATIARYNEAHKEEAHKWNIEWRQQHPDYFTEWRRKNPEKVKASVARYRDRNLEAVRQRFAEWEAHNPGHARAWALAHPERARLATQRRRAKRHSAETFEVTERDRRRALHRTGGCCTYCRKRIAGDYIAWDHVIPLVAGGRNSIGNLVPVCGRCNSSKSSYLLSEWRYMDRLSVQPSKRYYDIAA